MNLTDVRRMPKWARAAVIGSWSEQSWQRRVGCVRIVPEQKYKDGEIEKAKDKRKKKASKRQNRGLPAQLSAAMICRRERDVRDRLAAERAALPTCAFPPTQDVAADVAAAPHFLRFLSLSEDSAPPTPPSPPPEDAPRRSSRCLLRF